MPHRCLFRSWPWADGDGMLSRVRASAIALKPRPARYSAKIRRTTRRFPGRGRARAAAYRLPPWRGSGAARCPRSRARTAGARRGSGPRSPPARPWRRGRGPRCGSARPCPSRQTRSSPGRGPRWRGRWGRRPMTAASNSRFGFFRSASRAVASGRRCQGIERDLSTSKKWLTITPPRVSMRARERVSCQPWTTPGPAGRACGRDRPGRDAAAAAPGGLGRGRVRDDVRTCVLDVPATGRRMLALPVERVSANDTSSPDDRR